MKLTRRKGLLVGGAAAVAVGVGLLGLHGWRVGRTVGEAFGHVEGPRGGTWARVCVPQGPMGVVAVEAVEEQPWWGLPPRAGFDRSLPPASDITSGVAMWAADAAAGPCAEAAVAPGSAVILVSATARVGRDVFASEVVGTEQETGYAVLDATWEEAARRGLSMFGAIAVGLRGTTVVGVAVSGPEGFTGRIHVAPLPLVASGKVVAPTPRPVLGLVVATDRSGRHVVGLLADGLDGTVHRGDVLLGIGERAPAGRTLHRMRTDLDRLVAAGVDEIPVVLERGTVHMRAKPSTRRFGVL